MKRKDIIVVGDPSGIELHGTAIGGENPFPFSTTREEFLKWRSDLINLPDKK
jgi:hypothetical protein